MEKNLGELIERANPDFIETLVMDKEDYSHMKDYGLPITIHCMHNRFGVNMANPMKLKQNMKAIDLAIKTADMLNSNVIVIHPGYYENHSCNVETSIELLKGYSDKRIVIENMPFFIKKDSEIFNFGKSIDEMKPILDQTKKGFCLDFGHAPAAAYGLKKEYMNFVKDLIKLRPDYFHMSDSLVKVAVDEHIHLGEGELDLIGFKKLLPRNAQVALETPMDVDGRVKDIAFMRE